MFEVSDNSIFAVYARKRRWSRTLNIAFWVLQFLAAAAFLIAGATKHAGSIDLAIFQKIGLGQWLQYFIAGLEILGAILIVVPRTAGLAATVLEIMMIAAMATYVSIGGGAPIFTIVLLVTTIAIAWYRGVYE